MPTNFHAAFDGSTLIPPVNPRSQFVVRKVNDITVLDLIGSFAGAAEQHSQALREQIQAVPPGELKKFVMNLSQVPYIDSSGVGALLAAFRFIRAAGGNCKFAGAHPQVVHTLKTLNLHRVFDLFESETAALASF